MSTMKLPERTTSAWIDSLVDERLLKAEAKLYAIFSGIEREQKALLGARYNMMSGPPTLLAAWDEWAPVNAAARARGLNPLRKARPSAAR